MSISPVRLSRQATRSRCSFPSKEGNLCARSQIDRRIFFDPSNQIARYARGCIVRDQSRAYYGAANSASGESIGHNNEDESVRPLQRRLPRRRVARKALFVLPSSRPNLTLIPARHFRPNYQRQTGSEEGQRNRDSLAPKHMRNRATLFMRGNSVGDPTKRS